MVGESPQRSIFAGFPIIFHDLLIFLFGQNISLERERYHSYHSFIFGFGGPTGALGFGRMEMSLILRPNYIFAISSFCLSVRWAAVSAKDVRLIWIRFFFTYCYIPFGKSCTVNRNFQKDKDKRECFPDF